MKVPRGIQTVSSDHSRWFMSGGQFGMPLASMRLSIPHPDKPGQLILFGPEDMTILLHPDFLSETTAPPATQS